MKRYSRFLPLILMVSLVFILGACAPGNTRFAEAPAGFFTGIWHGFISFFTFIVGLFSDSVTIYETNNSGNWYNFGFILGIAIFYGGGSKSSCR